MTTAASLRERGQSLWRPPPVPYALSDEVSDVALYAAAMGGRSAVVDAVQQFNLACRTYGCASPVVHAMYLSILLRALARQANAAYCFAFRTTWELYTPEKVEAIREEAIHLLCMPHDRHEDMCLWIRHWGETSWKSMMIASIMAGLCTPTEATILPFVHKIFFDSPAQALGIYAILRGTQTLLSTEAS